MSIVARRVGLGVGAFIVFVAGALAVAGATYAPNTEMPPSVPGRHLEILGVPIRVDQRGAGRDILFIHGSPGSVEDGRPIIDPLAQDYRVTAYDRPGNGYSGDSGRYSLDYNASIALELIHALGLKRVVVVGHSYGGSTALAMALRDDPEVASYVILDSAAYTPARSPNFLMRVLDVPLIGMGFARTLGPLAAPKNIRAGLIEQFNERVPTESFLAERVALWNHPKVLHTIAAETLGSAEYLAAQSPRYPSIQRPVFIVSQIERENRRRSAERLHTEIRGSSLELLTDTGHFVQFEKPSEVVATIRRAATLP